MIKGTNIETKLDHLFRHESGKMISVITRIIGYDKVDEAEDIVQDTLLKAMQLWSIKGIPTNPGAWLYAVAKNKAIDIIRKNKNHVKYQSEVAQLLYSERSLVPTVDKMFLENEIQDSQLRLIFACCHKSLAIEYQIPLILKLVAGLNSKEISRALLINEETVNKRIYRAKKKLADNNETLIVPIGKEITDRLNIVNRVIYLIFNEGYNSTTGDRILRDDLCFEALRLTDLINNHPTFVNDFSLSLSGLIKCHLSRMQARFDNKDNLITLDKQDRGKWNKDLMNSGFIDLQKVQHRMSNKYFLEASISATHCNAKTFEETDWGMIISVYDRLYILEKSPYVLMNKYIAISYHKNPNEAIKLMLQLKELESYYLYNSTLSQLYRRIGDVGKAIKYIQKAIDLTENKQEIAHLTKKLNSLSN